MVRIMCKQSIVHAWTNYSIVLRLYKVLNSSEIVCGALQNVHFHQHLYFQNVFTADIQCIYTVELCFNIPSSIGLV